jgi:signal recognition particle subunit SRP54
MDPGALGGGDGLPPGFKLPKLDFGKLGKKDKDDEK